MYTSPHKISPFRNFSRHLHTLKLFPGHPHKIVLHPTPFYNMQGLYTFSRHFSLSPEITYPSQHKKHPNSSIDKVVQVCYKK